MCSLCGALGQGPSWEQHGLMGDEARWRLRREATATAAELTALLSPQRIKVTVWGYADMRCQAALQEFLVALDAEATRVRVEEVLMDIRALDFMSSGCFKHFVTWLATAKQESRPYRIAFHSNPALHWQKLSLRALSCFAWRMARSPSSGVSTPMLPCSRSWACCRYHKRPKPATGVSFQHVYALLPPQECSHKRATSQKWLPLRAQRTGGAHKKRLTGYADIRSAALMFT